MSLINSNNNEAQTSDSFIILEPEETGLSLALSEQSKTSFVASRPIQL